MGSTAWLCLIISLLLLSDSASARQNNITINCQGATFAEPVYSEWLFAYTLLRPFVTATYRPTGSGAGRTAAVDNTDDFAGSDNPRSDNDLLTVPWVNWYPTVVGQVALLYNIPGVPTETLKLSRSAVAGIFAGTITRWDHPLIAAANPDIVDALDGNITVIVRKESSGTTGIVYTACHRFDPVVFPYPTANSFPTSFLNSHPNFIPMQGSTGVSGMVQTLPFSIGYAALRYAISDSVPVALVENQQGEWISPYNSDATRNALANVDQLLNKTLNTYDLIDFNGTGAYPISSFTYLLLNNGDNYTDATVRREVLKFFRWAWTNPVAITTAAKLGYVPLPENLAVNYLINEEFSKIEIDGEQLLKVTHLSQHTSPLFEVLLAFTMLLWLLSILAICYAWWSSSRAKNPLFYALCLLFGCSAAFASAIFFYLVPRSDAVCELRKWLICVGLTVLLGVMFARGWQLHALKSGPRVISTLNLLIIVSIISSIQVVILICWSVIDPWASADRFSNDIDLQARYICHSDHLIVWLLIELAFFLVLLAWGIYVVYATWRNRAAVDSRWILIAVYNTLISFLIIIPIVATAIDSDDWVFYVAVLALDFAVASCVFSIYGSAILRRLWDQVKTSTSGDSGEHPAKVSSLRMTVGAAN